MLWCCRHIISSVLLSLLFDRCRGQTTEPIHTTEPFSEVLLNDELAAASGVAAGFLPGCIVFIMILFYLVNFPDKDIRRYVWQIISSTLSIFIAVLFFRASEGCIINLVSHLTNRTFIVKCIVLLLWFLFLQLTTGVLSGAIRMPLYSIEEESPSMVWMVVKPASSEQAGKIMDDYELDLTEENLPKDTIVEGHYQYCMYKRHGRIGLAAKTGSRESSRLEAQLLTVDCACEMLSHVVAFSAISVFGEVQQFPQFNKTAFTMLMVVPICGLYTVVLFRGLAKLRHTIMNADGKVDECEELWDHETAHAEMHVQGLVLSYFTLTSFSFGIKNMLVNETPHSAAMHEAFILFLLGMFLGIAIVIFVQWRKQNLPSHHGHGNSHEHDPNAWKGHLADGFQMYALMMVAWSVVFSVNMLTSTSPFLSETIFGKIAIALGVSVYVLSLVFVLDKIADSEASDDDVDAALIQIIHALGLALGFCWEVCFDLSFAIISDELLSEITIASEGAKRMVLSTVACGIVFPAWRWFICPTVQRLTNLAHEAAHGHEDHGKGHGDAHGGHGDAHGGHGGAHGNALPKYAHGHSQIEMQTMPHK